MLAIILFLLSLPLEMFNFKVTGNTVNKHIYLPTTLSKIHFTIKRENVYFKSNLLVTDLCSLLTFCISLTSDKENNGVSSLLQLVSFTFRYQYCSRLHWDRAKETLPAPRFSPMDNVQSKIGYGLELGLNVFFFFKHAKCWCERHSGFPGKFSASKSMGIVGGWFK